MTLDILCPIPCIDESTECKIDELAPGTVAILALNSEGVIRPLATSKAASRLITESELKQLGTKIEGFPSQFAITEVEGPGGCRVVSGGGGGFFVPCNS